MECDSFILLDVSRLIVLSAARYGLPVNYQALLLQTDKKRSKKLREELTSLFVHLDPTASVSKKEVRGQTRELNVKISSSYRDRPTVMNYINKTVHQSFASSGKQLITLPQAVYLCAILTYFTPNICN